ncbi:MAG TPA: hypothetical protein VF228_11610 [Iamia sp.]
MDRWSEDEDAEEQRPLRHGAPRDAEAPIELSWDGDPDLWDDELSAEQAADDELPPFEERYDPEELATIEAGPRRSDEPVTKVSQWRRRSALGAVLTGMALGLQEVFDPEEERSIVIEVDADGEPLDLPIQLFLDPDSPAGSLCVVHASDNRKPPVV